MTPKPRQTPRHPYPTRGEYAAILEAIVNLDHTVQMALNTMVKMTALVEQRLNVVENHIMALHTGVFSEQGARDMQQRVVRRPRAKVRQLRKKTA